ncbi:trehalose operon repressor [Paludibacterium yongneupense]|uniref:trehalose operon repressor n=1 Tax=Paludibacterium yongneupense TaxID=400061 RepID=UPI00041CAD5D|nr:trehalose operon repressor [Paludibacterium yongneupense]
MKTSKCNQIYQSILNEISNGKLQHGDKLDSENTLSEHHQASRSTVRKALDLLQERGYVQKIQGKGMFVLSPDNIEFNLGGIVSFQEVNLKLGRTVQTEVAEFLPLDADPRLAALLQVGTGERVDHIKRVRTIDGEKVILDLNYFVAALIPGLDRDIASASIYHYIEHELGLKISYAQRVIEAQPCNELDRRYLDLKGTDHVIVVKNRTFLYDGQQFEYTESRHRLDKFLFSDIARR